MPNTWYKHPISLSIGTKEKTEDGWSEEIEHFGGKGIGAARHGMK